MEALADVMMGPGPQMGQMGRVTLSYDDTPPTSNANHGVGGRGHPIAVSRTKKRWEEIWGVELMKARMPRGCRQVHASAIVEYATKGRRDSDNLYMPISKPLGDILVKMGFIPDDDPEHYAFERPVIRMGVSGLHRVTRSRTTVTITWDR